MGRYFNPADEEVALLVPRISAQCRWLYLESFITRSTLDGLIAKGELLIVYMLLLTFKCSRLITAIFENSPKKARRADWYS